MSMVGRQVFAPGRFRLLLLSLLLFIVGTAASTSARQALLIEFVLLTVTTVVAVLELRTREQRWLATIALALLVVGLALVDLTVPLTHVPMIASAVVGLFAGLVVWLAYASIMRPHRSVSDRIVGAICVYILIGLAWAKLFETLDGVVPGSFRFPADTAWTAPGPLRYRYFSFVTLATLGYGDVTPRTVLAGTLASLEAVGGQLYIGITVARLVALSLAERAGPDESSKSGA
jgi:voltage-gated potassium channel